MNAAGPLWRVFPWDRNAARGQRFSSSWVPETQGHGRFDLPAVPGGVLYLAETPEHAVAESIQHFRGQRLQVADLLIAGHPLSLVAVTAPRVLEDAIVDLCDPAALVQHGIRPDQTASGDRRITQRIAASLHSGGHAGLRWWSALHGDWHTVVYFRDRAGELAFGAPEPLSLQHAAVREAMRALGISARGQRAGSNP